LSFFLPVLYQVFSSRELMPLPHWLPTEGVKDAWQITAWGNEHSGVAREGAARRG
jgi:hypothetical protein